jgi:Mrp family chromosome partitioning ATPase
MIIAAGMNTKPLQAAPDADIDAEDYPFIEVGGSSKKLDASPAVLAAPAPSRSMPAAAASTGCTPPPQPAPRVVSMMPSETSTMSTAHYAGVQVLPSLESPPSFAANLCEGRPMCVTFEPWPHAGSATLRVAPQVIAYHQPNHPVSKQYALMFDKMMAGWEGRAPVLLFLGTAAQVGTSTALLNLAFSGCDKRRLVLIDANRRHPVVAEHLGLASSPSLSDVLAGTASVEQAMHKTVHPHVQAITASAQKAAQPFRGEALQWMLGWLRDRFFVVLIDGPSLDNGHDMDALMSACDGMYLVTPQHQPRSADWTENIARMGGRLRGLIHTHF